jgi:hypothetical protein
MRLKGRAGIARALYFARVGRRLCVVRVFVKKTEQTPRREIALALRRDSRLPHGHSPPRRFDPVPPSPETHSSVGYRLWSVRHESTAPPASHAGHSHESAASPPGAKDLEPAVPARRQGLLCGGPGLLDRI